MSQSMLTRLIAKDLYFNRWIVLATIGVGLVSVWISSFNQAGAMLGLILFVTTMIVFGIFVGQENLTRERREKISVFILSLPVSTRQYMLAKLLAALISYVGIWVILLVTIVALMLASANTPNGVIPMFTAIMGLLLMNFCVMLAIGAATTSQRWILAGVLCTNTAVTLFMVALFNFPAIQRTLASQEVVWPAVLIWSLAIQTTVIVLCFGFTFFSQSKKKIFI